MLKRCFTENSELFAISIHQNRRNERRLLSRRRAAAPRTGGGTSPLRQALGEKMTVAPMTMPILIVDDYNTMIRILRNLLRQLGFTNIDEANDGAAALAKMRVRDYALVISDAHMAPMSGVELLAQVRADQRTAATPFLMLANDADDGRIEGASNTIVKPFNAQTLKAKLVPVLGAF
jgi:two-component system chemotaxis response regulator CheY